MFTKLKHTQYPPGGKPLMVWDGECDFCAYWITRWAAITGSRVDYAPYQNVAEQFKDINRRHFMTASRLIETDGRIFSGPRSAYRTFTYGNSFWKFLDSWYSRKVWFTKLSDASYQFVAKHRGFLYKLTVALWGSNPANTRPFWVIYLGVIFYVGYILLR
jgi:predicted DCC family thiol-disulfide oxidoreductase YuxK